MSSVKIAPLVVTEDTPGASEGAAAPEENEHPPSFYCPISCQVMHDPVVLSDGHTYERRHIERWLSQKGTSPVTGAALADGSVMFPNHALRNAIEEYFKKLFDDRRSAIRKAKTDEAASGNDNSDGTHVALLKTVDALMSMSVLVNADLSEEQMLRAIVKEAKDLIGAEVASVFLVDYAKDELFSTVNSTDGEIRIPRGAGIAGLVATTGEPVVIEDAYSDTRFNKKVDLETGFRTRDIMCVPIKSKKGKVIGVVQLINKTPAGSKTPRGALAKPFFADEGDEAAAAATRVTFSPDDTRFLLVFSAQAAAAIMGSGGSFDAPAAPRAAPPASVEGKEGEGKSDSGSDADEVVKPPRQAAVQAAAGGGVDVALAAAAQAAYVADLLEDAFTSWSTDTLLLSQLTNGKPLSTLGPHLFSKLGLVEAFGMDPATLRRFFVQVERGYSDDHPYHNKAHAANVLQQMHALLKHGGVAAQVGEGKWFEPPAAVVALQQQQAQCQGQGDASVAAPSQGNRGVGMMETLACLFAAAVHDLDHLGLTNQFLVATVDPRALRYNDAHVNESHHISTAFELLLRPGNNFLTGLSLGEFKMFRELVVRLVVGTDMGDDKAILAQLNSALKANRAAQAVQVSSSSEAAPTESAPTKAAAGLRPASKEEAIVCLTMALKAADVGHLALPWDLHLAWVKRLEAEFFYQGDLEQVLGLPCSFLMDRSKPGVSETQGGFFQFVVDPLFAAVLAAFPAAGPMAEAVSANKALWVAKDDAKKAAAAAAAEAAAAEATEAAAAAASAQAAAEAPKPAGIIMA